MNGEHTYALASDPFATIQGEGVNVGRVALFVRFSGCNLWTGREDTRLRDAARTGARCPKWCDTDFLPRVRGDRAWLVERIVRAAEEGIRLIVFTGGEPLLQLDAGLVEAIRAQGIDGLELAVETNGATLFRFGVEQHIDHVCVSPKLPPSLLELTKGTEIKVVAPAYDLDAFDRALDEGVLTFQHRFAQPLARVDGSIDPGHQAEVVAWVRAHPRWRLSLQTHKMIGVP